MSEETEKILIVATHGPDDPEHASFPFVIANAALAMDVKVIIALQGTAVLLARKCVAGHVFAAGLPPFKKLMDDFFSLGGEMIVCHPCVTARQIETEDLVDGAVLAGGARVVMESLEANAVFNY